MSEIAMKGDAEMGVKSLFGIRGARDKPEDIEMEIKIEVTV